MREPSAEIRGPISEEAADRLVELRDLYLTYDMNPSKILDDAIKLFARVVAADYSGRRVCVLEDGRMIEDLKVIVRRHT